MRVLPELLVLRPQLILSVWVVGALGGKRAEVAKRDWGPADCCREIEDEPVQLMRAWAGDDGVSQLLEVRVVADIGEFARPEESFEDPRQIHIHEWVGLVETE